MDTIKFAALMAAIPTMSKEELAMLRDALRSARCNRCDGSGKTLGWHDGGSKVGPEACSGCDGTGRAPARGGRE